MLKLQISLIIGAIALTAGLISLPKVIIKDSKKSNTLNNSASDATENTLGKDFHTASFTKEQKATLIRLKAGFSTTNKNQKIQFADSLSAFFDTHNQWDSAGHYAEFIAHEKGNSSNFWKQAGDFYYQGFLFAIALDKSKILAEKARTCYQKALTIAPTDLDSKAKMAMTYTVTDTPMTGIGILKEILVENPKHELTLFNLGLLSMQSNQYEKAIEKFEQLKKVNPNHIEGLFYLANSYLTLNNEDKALENFQKLETMPLDSTMKVSVEENIQKIKQHSH